VSSEDSLKNDVMKDIYSSKMTPLLQHRDTLSALYNDKVYSNEWITALVLFLINIFFVVQINYGRSVLFNAMAAALCASLSMLMFILLKYSTLTHKDAKQIWQPIKVVLRRNFEDV
jgi:hypothetical protein